MLHFAEGWNTKQVFHLTSPPHRITSPSAFIVWTVLVEVYSEKGHYFTVDSEIV